MTAPDGDRLPATNSGPETCSACGHLVGYHAGVLGCLTLLGGLRDLHRCGCPAPQQPPALGDDWESYQQESWANPEYRAAAQREGLRPPDRQPPAQEREDDRYEGFTGNVMPPDGVDWSAPPSEADSAGEDGLAERVTAACARYVDDQADYADRGDFDGDLSELLEYVLPALAASPGVQGGDGEALHEWPCPNCGAVTRARMADHDDGEARERLAAVLALHQSTPRGQAEPSCAECTSGWKLVHWPCPTVRAAGGGR